MKWDGMKKEGYYEGRGRSRLSLKVSVFLEAQKVEAWS